MVKELKVRKFSLLGHRTVKALLNEDAFGEGQDLELVVLPTVPQVSGEHEGKKVLVFTVTILIAKLGTTKTPKSAKLMQTPPYSLTDTALGVTVEAGYAARGDEDDGDLKSFSEMFPHAVATAFRAARAAAQVLAHESSFNASHIPQEVDESEFFAIAGAQEKKARKPKSKSAERPEIP